MLTPEKTEGRAHFRAYVDEREAIAAAVGLARLSRQQMVVLWCPIADRKCYRVARIDWRQRYDWGIDWALIGIAEPSGSYHQ